MRVFIAGPMASVTDFNYRAFDAAELWLLTSFETVHNPCRHRREEMHLDLEDCPNGSLIADKGYNPTQAANHCRHAIRWDVEKLTASDVIALLPYWSKCSYAKCLAKFAEFMGLGIMAIPEHVVDAPFFDDADDEGDEPPAVVAVTGGDE